MTDTLLVVLDDAVAGVLTRLSGGRLRLDYDEGYRARPDATPLSVSMPLQVPTHPDHVVTPWLWGLLPDNNAVVERWAREFHVSASSPFSLLASPVGEDCAGAVRFVAPDQIDRVLARSGDITWLSDDEVARRLKDLREDPTAWLGRTFTGQFSLAGAQAKTALLLRDGRWGVPSGSTPTTHILKPALAGFDDHDLNEHLCLDAARRLGLITAFTRVARFADTSALVIDRYDRIETGDAVVRVHQEDLCQALGLPPSRKYQGEGGPAPGDIVRLVRRIMPFRPAEDSILRFADALIWNWIIGGTDAHAKNYSLLLSGDQIRLAPLYDIASALPYDTHERKLRMAMKVGGDYRLVQYTNTWPRAAIELGIDRDRLLARVHELTVSAPSAFAEAAGSPDVVALDSLLPELLVEEISRRCAWCLRLLARGKRAHAEDG